MTNMTISSPANTAITVLNSNVQRPATPAGVAEPQVAAPAAPAPTPVKSAEPQLEQVQQAIERVKESIKPTLANSLDFQIDQSTGKTVVKIMDLTTNTLVRQIPSEEMLIIARALDNFQGRGGLVKGQA